MTMMHEVNGKWHRRKAGTEMTTPKKYLPGRRRRFLLAAFLTAALLTAASQRLMAQGSATACNQAAPEPITFVDVPGHPFTPIPTMDGCWIFVSLSNPKGGPPSGIGVLRRAGGVVSVARVVAMERGPAGMVLTHDGKVLIGAVDDRIVFLDTARLISGNGKAVLGYYREPKYHGDLGGMKIRTPGAVYVNVTSDDRWLFVSDEWAQRITVLDLKNAQNSGFKSVSLVGAIPTGVAPIAVTLSPDGRYLYTTAEAADRNWGWPADCKQEGQDPNKARAEYPQGAVVVIDVARAVREPATSVIAKVPAGCSAVRLALSANGDRAYVTARNADALLAFDADKLVHDPEHALIGKVPVGRSPVGVEVADSGTKVVTANSNRFAGSANTKQNLTVIDTAKLASGPDAVLGVIPAGGFPRELRMTADGQTLLVTNFTSNTLELADLARVPLQPR